MKISLKAARVNRNLTQKELANITGLSLSTIYKIENNLINPSYKNLMKICYALKVDINDICLPDII